MDRLTLEHLDCDWEVTVQRAEARECLVRFRSLDEDHPRMQEARVDLEELEDPDPAERELALRRALEASLVLKALAEGADPGDGQDGLTVEELARRTGMPPEAVVDRLDVLESVEPVLDPEGPRRYRRVGRG